MFISIFYGNNVSVQRAVNFLYSHHIDKQFYHVILSIEFILYHVKSFIELAAGQTNHNNRWIAFALSFF
jgi:hypothetical protein